MGIKTRLQHYSSDIFRIKPAHHGLHRFLFRIKFWFLRPNQSAKTHIDDLNKLSISQHQSGFSKYEFDIKTVFAETHPKLLSARKRGI